MGMYHLLKSGTRYHWNLRAGNGEIILQSEMYSTKQGAQKGIESCKVNSPHDDRYLRKVATNSQPFFVLRALNNEIIGASEMYSSSQARESGIASCKANGPISGMKDETIEK